MGYRSPISMIWSAIWWLRTERFFTHNGCQFHCETKYQQPTNSERASTGGSSRFQSLWTFDFDLENLHQRPEIEIAGVMDKKMGLGIDLLPLFTEVYNIPFWSSQNSFTKTIGSPEHSTAAFKHHIPSIRHVVLPKHRDTHKERDRPPPRSKRSISFTNGWEDFETCQSDQKHTRPGQKNPISNACNCWARPGERSEFQFNCKYVLLMTFRIRHPNVRLNEYTYAFRQSLQSREWNRRHKEYLSLIIYSWIIPFYQS
jgi:hypothetical protein